MARPAVSVTSDAIRIEDEVWQEAFATRVPSSRRSARPDPAPDRPVVAVAPVSAGRTSGDPGRATSVPAAARAATASDSARRTTAPIPARRTVTIRGRGAERNLPWPGESSRRRPPRPLHERSGFRPDRMAMWAMVLGLLLVLIAVISSHG